MNDSQWLKVAEFISGLVRSFAGKYITRAVTYGGAALAARLAISSPDADMQTKLSQWCTAALCAVVGMVIDYLHHRADKIQAAATPPPAPAAKVQ